MSGFKVVQMDLGSLETKYPHKPSNHSASMEDYLQEMLEEGWDFVTSTVDGNGYRWIFRAVGKAKGK